MNTYIALFRGINVGGTGLLPMKDLVTVLEGLGCGSVRTYIQSGNAVFGIGRDRARGIAGEIASAVQERFGFRPTVLLLEKRELLDAVERNPFDTKDGKALHFFFLDAAPGNPDLERLAGLKSKSEEFRLQKKVFYLHAPDGIGRSKLAAKAEQCLGVPATARNWNTVSRLMAMAEE
jgi:uncharacterized protein (DUF1697 family)